MNGMSAELVKVATSNGPVERFAYTLTNNDGKALAQLVVAERGWQGSISELLKCVKAANPNATSAHQRQLKDKILADSKDLRDSVASGMLTKDLKDYQFDKRVQSDSGSVIRYVLRRANKAQTVRKVPTAIDYDKLREKFIAEGIAPSMADMIIATMKK